MLGLRRRPAGLKQDPYSEGVLRKVGLRGPCARKFVLYTEKSPRERTVPFEVAISCRQSPETGKNQTSSGDQATEFLQRPGRDARGAGHVTESFFRRCNSRDSLPGNLIGMPQFFRGQPWNHTQPAPLLSGIAVFESSIRIKCSAPASTARLCAAALKVSGGGVCSAEKEEILRAVVSGKVQGHHHANAENMVAITLRTSRWCTGGCIT